MQSLKTNKRKHKCLSISGSRRDTDKYTYIFLVLCLIGTEFPWPYLSQRKSCVYRNNQILDSEGFLNIFSNSLFSLAAIAGRHQEGMQQIILPEQRQSVSQNAFPSTVMKTAGCILISVLSPLCAWSRHFFIYFVLN